MCKISVIIPCYNVEKYLDKCVSSLLTQSLGLGHLELIFVNDASTDGTLGILLDYERNYRDVISVVDLLVKSTLCPSKSDARRAIEQGGVTINDEKVEDVSATLKISDFSENVILKRGKKNFKKIVII